MEEHDHEQAIFEYVDRVVLTPAERALLVEQGETAKVALTDFVLKCKAGDSKSAIMAFLPVVQAVSYIGTLIGQKVESVMINELTGE